MHGKDQSWHRAVKRGSAGAGSPQGGLAQRRSLVPARPEPRDRRGRRGASCVLGSRAISRVLVSNVGCRSWREASSTFHRGLPRGRQRRGGGSAARRRVRTGRVERGGRKGAEGSSAWTFTGKHESTHSVARSRVEPAEGAPATFVAASLTGGRYEAAWQRGWSPSLTKDGRGARTRGRNLRASVHEATGSVRGGGVGFGPPSRRAQGVCSQRRRHV